MPRGPRGKESVCEPQKLNQETVGFRQETVDFITKKLRVVFAKKCWVLSTKNADVTKQKKEK